MNWKTYTAYKESGFEWMGQIPSCWTMQKCKYVLREVNERSENGLECLLSVSEYYGVAPKSDVVEEGDFLTHADSLEGHKKCAAGDLVINIMLAWKKGLGVSPVAGIVSPAYSVFRCIQPNCNPRYLHHLLRTNLYVTQFKTKSS